ncbi:MAG: family transporter protein [Symbiobacteriaceae bacterium]|nr:family transporter protein [Symbiobacteriaceae bacterium]
MVQVLVLAFYDLKATLQDRWGTVLLLVMPPLLVLLLAYGLAPLVERNHFVEPFAVAVVDQDGSYETRMLVHQLSASPALTDLVTVRTAGMDEADALIRANEIAAVLIIPQEFAAQMAQGVNLPLTVISNPSRPLQSAIIRQLAHSSASLVTAAQSGVVTVLTYMDEAGVSGDEYSQWYGRTVTAFSLTALGRTQLLAARLESATGPASALQYYALALGVLFLLVTGMAGLWNVRGEGAALFYRYRSLGVATWQQVTARVLVLMALQGLQAVVTLSLLAPVFRPAWQGNGLLAACVLLAALAANAGLLTLIAVAVPDRTAACLVALSLLLVMAVLGGSVLPPAYLPPAAQWLGNLSVAKWAVTGLLSSVFTLETGAVLASLGALTLLTGASAGAAGLWLNRTGR